MSQLGKPDERTGPIYRAYSAYAFIPQKGLWSLHLYDKVAWPAAEILAQDRNMKHDRRSVS